MYGFVPGLFVVSLICVSVSMPISIYVCVVGGLVLDICRLSVNVYLQKCIV